MSIEATDLALPGALLLKVKRHGDPRGSFSEVWSRRQFAACGIHSDFVQDNWSLSREVNTVRGLHYQAPPHAQDKLVRVTRGRITDVIVDIRKGSPTFGRFEAVDLSADDGLQIFVPSGFLHGFVTREPDTEVVYKCSNYYAPGFEGAVRFDDPDLAIAWGVEADDAILSEKDAKAPSFRELGSPFEWKG